MNSPTCYWLQKVYRLYATNATISSLDIHHRWYNILGDIYHNFLSIFVF